MRAEEAIRLFGLNNLAIESDIRELEKELGIDIGDGKNNRDDFDQTYYPQFAQKLRLEASRMSRNYVIFYCLENSMREIIAQRLEEKHGTSWWDTAVPEAVRNNAKKNLKKESASGITMRSTELIDFTNFGELAEIIKSNWDTFDDMFRDVNALQRVLGTLNTLRGPIAHCKAFAEDEELRLHLGLRDWFRLME